MYCLTGANPVACPAGHYCPEGTRFDKQYACPAGFYNTATGKATVVECLHCGVGKYCPDKGRATAGIYCAAGTYNNISTSAIICEICPPGNYCPITANAAGLVSAEPSPCVPGTYSVRGAKLQADCKNCPVGTYCPLYGTSDTKMREQVCPEGTYCRRKVVISTVKYEFGLDKYPSSETDKCPRYKYCPRGLSVNADPPVTGTGVLLDPPVFSNLPKVPPGLSQRYYSVGKISQAEAMPAGFYFKEKTAMDVTALDPCTKGNYCPSGTVTPIGCPKGTYRNDLHGTDVN